MKILIPGFTLFVVFLAACSAAPASESTSQPLFIGPLKVECEGEGPQECLLAKEKLDDDYGLFYDQIEGFEFEEGFEYELRVRTEEIENPPAGGSSIRWILEEVVSKTRVELDSIDSSAGGSELEGKVWTLLEFATADGSTQPSLEGSQVTAEFNDGNLNGNASCNNYFGSYEIQGSNIMIGPLGANLQACPPPELMDQETAYLSALSLATKFSVSEDELVLSDADGEFLLRYQGKDPDTLVGSNWEIVSYNNGREAVVSVIIDTRITADFADDGTVSGFSGCNNYSGTYVATEDSVEIGPLAVTEKFCAEPEGVMDQESEYLAALQTAASYTIRRGVLDMRTDDGARVLTGTELAEDGLTDTDWTVVGYNNGRGGVTSVIIGTELTALFSADGMISGSAGCNNYTGRFTTEGELITIGPLATTRMACSDPEGIMEQENEYLAALQRAATWSISVDRLELRDGEGALQADFLPPEE